MIDLGTLFKIAESSEVLDAVEADLRAAGFGALAGDLVKLQQDVGIEIDREINGIDDDPAPGPQTAALRAAYRETSLSRLDVLREAAVFLKDFGVKARLEDVIATLPAPQPAFPPAQPYLGHM